MTERTLVAKKIEAKAEAPGSRVQKAEHPLSVNLPVEQILFLQRTAGNQAVQKLIKKRALQAKLKTSQNDIHEQEAGRVAEQVTGVPDSIIQKQTNPEEEKEGIVQTKPFVNREIPLIQRQFEKEKEEEPVQRKEANQTLDISPNVQTIINSLQGRGHPLPDQVRGYFEPRFGQDFGNVHVHTDSNAVLAAQAINAKAFTVGQDVVFGAGQYAPDTIEGKRLLGHELTHVIQQEGKRNSINAKEESDENLSWLERAKKWAFEKALGAAGIPKEQMMGIIRKAGSAIREIFEKPGRFLGTLIKAVGQGFIQFKDRIGEHLKAGFMGWLFGTMAKTGIVLPKDFSPESILSLVLQVLGISANFIRQKFVKLIGEKNVKRFEKAWQVLSTLMSQGVGGLWKMLKEHIGNLKEMVIDQTRNWVITEIIKSAVMKIVSMFNPVSGLITIIKTIYNVIKFLIERARSIKDLFTAIIESVVELAMGSISSAANKIEQALARLIPIAIGFLASLLGISGITDKIKEIIKRISSTVDRAIDKVLEKAVKPFAKKLKGIFEKGKEKVIGAGKSIAQVGLPKDPKERVKLAARAAVSAARKLTGRVTQALLTPVLSVIKVRYGLKEIQPYEKGGTWWVKATINPIENVDTGISSTVNDKKKNTKVSGQFNPSLEVGRYKDLKKVSGREIHHVPPTGLLRWIVIQSRNVENSTRKLLKEFRTYIKKEFAQPRISIKELFSKIIKIPMDDKKRAEVRKSIRESINGKETLEKLNNSIMEKLRRQRIRDFFGKYNWILQISSINPKKRSLGAPLAAISISQFTHIKKIGDINKDAWRAHYGIETAKEVLRRLNKKGFRLIYNKDSTISTQLRMTQLNIALDQLKEKWDDKLEQFQRVLSIVSRGAAAQAYEALSASLDKSTHDGTSKQRSKALAKLKSISKSTWNEIQGIKMLYIFK